MDQNTKRILAVDWGSKRIGLALSDPTRTIASPLGVVTHSARAKDAETIIQTAIDKDASLILVGITYDPESNPTPAGRSALRLVEAIREQSSLDVRIWSEEGSTREAKRACPAKSGKDTLTPSQPRYFYKIIWTRENEKEKQ
jgi:putative Holliday junction resolvase